MGKAHLSAFGSSCLSLGFIESRLIEKKIGAFSFQKKRLTIISIICFRIELHFWKFLDYFLNLRIADQSYMASGLSVNFFAESTAKLPHVMSSGDIICLHGVVPRVYEGEVHFAFEKNLSSFALFEGKCGSRFNPYQTSYNFHAMERMDLIKKLRTWSLDYHADADAKNYTSQLKEIEVDLEINLICKVLHVCEAGEDELIFYVWDGTDYPPLSVQTDLDSEINHPIPLQLEISPPPIDVLRVFPHVGSILRLTSGMFPEEIIRLVDGKHWVKFRKIICENRSGIWSGTLCNSSKVSVLSDEDESVLLRERNYNERIMAARLCQPMSCFPYMFSVTETDFFHLADATLMDSLAHPEVTHNCKCVVRVVAACPWRAKDFVSLQRGQYRLRLTLEDPTARIHAYICGDDGVKFFGENPSVKNLDTKMSKLLGIPQEPTSENSREGKVNSRDPPWVEICLRSYCLDVDRPWESRRYRIFATELLD